MIGQLGTSQGNCKWATRVHCRYFLWENSRCTHKFPIWDILVTWPGTLQMYQQFPCNEPLGYTAGTFFGKIENVPINYLIRTSQSHHWEHCEYPDHFLAWGNCRETGLENCECTFGFPAGYLAGTLSMSLQCICSVPGGYTTPCPQCQELEPRGSSGSSGHAPSSSRMFWLGIPQRVGSLSGYAILRRPCFKTICSSYQPRERGEVD